MNYPVNCKKCNQPLYGPVRYCPFCRKDTISATPTPVEKIKKEKVKTPVEEKVVLITPPIKEPEPEPEVVTLPLVEEKVDVETPTTKKNEEIIEPRPKPLFWKIALVLGLIVIVIGVFIAKTVINTEPKVGQPKEIKGNVVEPPKVKKKQASNKGPAATGTADLNAEREKIRQEAEREALAKVEAERQRQAVEKEALANVEAERQRQEQAIRQREIDTYLSEGKMSFQKGKYELCIEKMKEVLKRDRNNYEAEKYVRMSQDEQEKINKQFKNPNVGRAR